MISFRHACAKSFSSLNEGMILKFDKKNKVNKANLERFEGQK